MKSLARSVADGFNCAMLLNVPIFLTAHCTSASPQYCQEKSSENVIPTEHRIETAQPEIKLGRAGNK